jgi:hypothetical protein
MDSMLDLRDLIISRIEQVRRIPAEQAALVSALAPPTIEAELQLNRGIIRLLTSLKRQEKERVKTEDDLLEEMRALRFLTTKTIDEVSPLKVRSTQLLWRYLASSMSVLGSMRKELTCSPPPIGCGTSSLTFSKSISLRWPRGMCSRCYPTTSLKPRPISCWDGSASGRGSSSCRRRRQPSAINSLDTNNL